MTTLEKLEDLIYRGFKETAELQKETARQSQETERRFQETDRLLKDYAREQKADSEKLRSQMYGLTRSLGLFAESMVYPSVVRLFTERGIALTGAYTRSRERRNGSTMEVDVLNDEKFIPRVFGESSKKDQHRKK